MDCFFCGEKMDIKTTSLETGWGKYELVIKGVKAHVCPSCGNKVYSPEEVKMIQDISQGLSEANSKNSKPDVLNVEEVADLLRVTTQTVYNMLKDGRISATKVGREWRFSRQQIQGLLQGAGQSGNDSFRYAARGNVYKEDLGVLAEIVKEGE